MTTFLTFDEVFYKLSKLCGFEKAVLFTENFLTLPNLTFADVNSQVTLTAFNLIKQHKIHPRDAIHAATAQLYKADFLISEDKNLLELTWLRSITISGFLKYAEDNKLFP